MSVYLFISVSAHFFHKTGIVSCHRQHSQEKQATPFKDEKHWHLRQRAQMVPAECMLLPLTPHGLRQGPPHPAGGIPFSQALIWLGFVEPQLSALNTTTANAWMLTRRMDVCWKFIIIIMYPLTARVVGAPQMISQLVSSIIPSSSLPSGTWQVWPFPDVVFPPLPLSALSSSPFHCALQDVFCRTWWTVDMTYYCSLRLFTMVRSSHGLIAYLILARTSLLVTWSLNKMCNILR